MNGFRTASQNDLQALLRRIDHKGYPAYKDTKGRYQFSEYIVSIDHVQGDPFASPSKVSIIVPGKQAGFAASLYDTKEKRIALEDVLLRKFSTQVRRVSFTAKGSGKSGMMSVSSPGQEVLERSALVIDPANGDLIVRMEIGFPANGRTINAGELEKILFRILPECIRQSLYQKAYKPGYLKAATDLAEDQLYIREQLSKLGYVAFVANGAVLPRKSGISSLPMQDAVPFVSPASMELTLELPHHGTITGMGIQKGVTLIVGGGYHGKSTLLKALELGVYNHVAGDGREYVITDASAMKLRAEDGRGISHVDISMFIHNLPNGKDTTAFSTEDASGSTSQATSTVEAIEMGAKVFLIDEDTSATNFMIRDELMQRVVAREVEPIIPFIDRVRELYEVDGISTILVAGSSGSYFHKADCVIQMKQYAPVEITELAKQEAEHFPLKLETLPAAATEGTSRIVMQDTAFAKDNRIKIKTMGLDGFSVNRSDVDLRYVEQLVDPEQVTALAHILKYLKLHVFDGRKSVCEAVEALYDNMEHGGFSAFAEGLVPGNLSMPRKQEMYAMLNRCRDLIRIR